MSRNRDPTRPVTRARWDVDGIPVNGDMCRAVNDDVNVMLTASISRIAALRSCRRSKRQIKDEQDEYDDLFHCNNPTI